MSFLEEALALAEKTGDLRHQVVLHQRLSYFHGVMGNGDELLRVCDRAMALAGGDVRIGADWGGFSSYLVMMAARAMGLALAGRLTEARAASEAGLRLASEHGDDEVAILACGFAADPAVRSGDIAGALRLATRAAELAERSAIPFFRVNGSTVLALALAEAGEWTEAIAAADRGLGLARQHRIIFLELSLRGSLALALLGAGDHARARVAALEVLGLCARFPDPRFSRITASTRAVHVLLRTDGASAEALRALEEAEALAAAIPDRFCEAQLLLKRAEVARLRGDEAGRRELLAEAERRFTEMGATARAEQVARELSRM